MTAGLRHLRIIALWAMLSPFLMLSLLSPSVMPARQTDGTLALVLCSVDGPGEVVIDLATGQPVEQAPDSVHDRCDWACGQMAVADLMRPGVPPVAIRARRADPPPAATVLHLASLTGLPPATGPPAAA